MPDSRDRGRTEPCGQPQPHSPHAWLDGPSDPRPPRVCPGDPPDPAAARYLPTDPLSLPEDDPEFEQALADAFSRPVIVPAAPPPNEQDSRLRHAVSLHVRAVLPFTTDASAPPECRECSRPWPCRTALAAAAPDSRPDPSPDARLYTYAEVQAIYDRNRDLRSYTLRLYSDRLAAVTARLAETQHAHDALARQRALLQAAARDAVSVLAVDEPPDHVLGVVDTLHAALYAQADSDA